MKAAAVNDPQHAIVPPADDETSMPDHLHVDRDRPVCANLRTKALHVFGRDTGDLYRTSRSSSYQCLSTSFVTGPDGALCAPEECQPGRACFRSR